MPEAEGELSLDEVVDRLLDGATWSASRSSGPGGQHRDKASTRAELTIDDAGLEGLPPDVAEALVAGLGLDQAPLRILVQDERYLSRNREIAARRLRNLVAAALAPPPPPRRPTRPTRSAKEERLGDKVRRGATKRLRRAPDREVG